MKIIYTNISPVTNAYTNLNHIYSLKKQNPQKVYLCIWDNFVYEHPIFEKSLGNNINKQEKLKENVLILEKLLSYLKIDYKIIYLSEAINRLFKNSFYVNDFQKIFSNIKIDDLKKGFDLDYIPFCQISLSKINYIIYDYLIATYLAELYPELCSSSPNYYLTSERFKAFHNTVNQHFKNNFSKHSPPKTIFVQNVPVIIHPEKEVIPSLEMSIESINKIVSSYYTKKPSEKEFNDIIEVFANILKTFEFKGKRMDRNKIRNLNHKESIEFISSNMSDYFSKILKIISKINVEDKKKSFFISNYKEFNDTVKSLNNIKFEILKNCNGANSSLDISKITGLKLSTVSTYLNHLKNKKLIDNFRKPKRLIDSFVIDMEAIEND